MADALQITDILQVLVAFLALAISVPALALAIAGRRREEVFYVHAFASREDFVAARHHIRGLQARGSEFARWSDKDREQAHRVCVCYDQVGVLVLQRGIGERARAPLLKSSWGRSICDQHEWLESYLDQEENGRPRREFFEHFESLAKEARTYVVSRKKRDAQ